MQYQGMIQTGPNMCVFASVAAAINHVVGSAAWTQDTLLGEWRAKGFQDHELDFGNLIPVAASKAAVKLNRHLDNGNPISNADYLNMIDACLGNGGIAIVSMELADAQGNPQGKWHMISLVGRIGAGYDAWDTANGSSLVVTAAQLVSKLTSGGATLMVHGQHDVLLIEQP